MPKKVASEQKVLFESRFIEHYVGGRLLRDPISAATELVANAWDGGSTRVEIAWPDHAGGRISVSDNGHGMTQGEFLHRWRTLSYDRIRAQGKHAEFPPDVVARKRLVFGRNGVGRFAAFCFSSTYEVESYRNGKAIRYRVSRGLGDVPFEVEELETPKRRRHGTTISTVAENTAVPSTTHIRQELSARFLTDPDFRVLVNGTVLSFEDLAEGSHDTTIVQVPSFGELSITTIVLPRSDRTTHRHGVAWHVNGRLVGDCSWEHFNDRRFIDGRTAEAKRFTFLIRSDFLLESVLPDWSWFRDADDAFAEASSVAAEWIKQRLLDDTEEKRAEVYEHIAKHHALEVRDLTPSSKVKWSAFIRTVQQEVPSVGEDELKKLSGILVNQEKSEAKYSLISQLHSLDPSRLDALSQILRDWTVDMAREALGELQLRLRLLEELQHKVFREDSDEVHELQPLFERGLWIFGPEFETIEFTSNQGMTNVIQELFGKSTLGSRNRPDFAVLPDSSVGLYSYCAFDDEGAEVGVAKLVIVELKRANVPLGATEKGQCWKYIKELFEKGLLDGRSQVVAFVLGAKIESFETAQRSELEGRVCIRPIVYQTVIERAKSRLLKLYDRVKDAPFLVAERERMQGPQLRLKVDESA